MKIIYCIILLISVNLYSQDIMRIYSEASMDEFVIDDIKSITFQNVNIALTDFNITPSEIELKVNETFQIPIEFLPENATNKNVNWLTHDETIATVSETGFITAINEGIVIILGETENGNLKDSAIVFVSKVNSVKINDDSFKLFPNPTDKILNIQLKNDLPFEVIIVDNLGNQIYSEYNAKSIDISNFTTGSYIVYINQNNNFYSYKLIKN